MSRVLEDTGRNRGYADAANLVLLHPGEVTDAELAGHLVALLFAAAGPLATADAARLLEISPERLAEVCDLLQREPPAGLALQRWPDRLQLTTAPSSCGVIERYLGAPPPVRLSRAALESLAVIAYRGPATRGEIDAIRGVNSDSAVATLLSRNLVAEVGRRETVGRPALLAITPDCLQYLGVTSLEELPGLPASEVSEPTVPAPEVSAPESLSLEGFSPELEAEAAQRATGAADEGVADEAEPEAPAPNVDVTEGDEPHAETLAAAGESEADGPAAEALEATVRDAEREDGAENASHADE